MKKMCLFVLAVVSGFLLVACGAPRSPFVEAPPATKPPKPMPLPTQTSSNKNLGHESFSINTVDKVAPENILQEVAFFGSGGDTSCQPGSPFIILGSEKAELFQKALVQSCGWKLDEKIAVEIKGSDGGVESQEIIAKPLHEGGTEPTVRFFLYPAQKGTYEVTLSGASGNLLWSFQVSQPDQPRMYMVNQIQLVFYNLQPHENILLYAYSANYGTKKMEFMGWKSYQADSSGNLTVQIDAPDLFYYALGEASGYLEDKNRTGVGIDGSIFK